MTDDEAEFVEHAARYWPREGIDDAARREFGAPPMCSTKQGSHAGSRGRFVIAARWRCLSSPRSGFQIRGYSRLLRGVSRSAP